MEETRRRIQKWYFDGKDFKLGEVQFIQVEDWIWVANMIGQRGIYSGSSGPPVRYEAVKECLVKVADKAKDIGASVHMPRICCGLGGGKWNKVEPLIEQSMDGLNVIIYDFS